MASMVDRETPFAARLAAVRDRIAEACRSAGRDPAEVRLVGVSKTRPAAEVLAALEAGLADFGENYAQELERKAREVQEAGGRPRWHFIGHLQTNKVRRVLPLLASVHSVDRPSLVRELGAGTDPGHPLEVFVEVNLGDEASKTGVRATDAEDLCRQVLAAPGLRLVGLMGMPPLAPDPEASRPHFRRLRDLLRDLQRRLPCPPETFRHLSMGMSDDLEVAVQEGATWVRVGTALFGPRRTP